MSAVCIALISVLLSVCSCQLSSPSSAPCGVGVPSFSYQAIFSFVEELARMST